MNISGFNVCSLNNFSLTSLDLTFSFDLIRKSVTNSDSIPGLFVNKNLDPRAQFDGDLSVHL